MTIKFNIVTDEGEPSSVTVFPEGRMPLAATREHPNFTAIMEQITVSGKSEDDIIGLFDTAIGLNLKFNKVSDRVSIRSGKVFFDNMETASVLTDAIIRFYLAGHDDYMSLVNFMEKIETNPNPNSREHLFRWLSSGKFSITPDGDIIGYKAVNRRTGQTVVRSGDPRDEYESIHAGPAIVDGEPVKGHVPNNPGVIVEMARNEVTFDPHQTCSTGLHVADWSYAKNTMGGHAMLMVLVNPRDVVSVPTDYGDKKMRVCRYKVLAAVTQEDTEMLHVNRELQTLTARMPTWVAPKQITKSTEPRGVKKVAAKVKKAVAKKTAPKKAAASLAPTTATKAPPKVTKAPVKKAAPGKKAPAKKAPATKVTKPVKLPKYYEQFTLENFATLPYLKLQWLAKQWEVTTTGLRTAAALSKALHAEAQVRLAKTGRKTPSAS
jgi:hypothetical protein